MHIYVNKVIDWVIAESVDDANAVLSEHYGYTLEQLIDDDTQITEQLPDDKPLTLDEDGSKTTLTAAEWIAKEGRCLLGSTEY
jgi:hypothetical protein